MKRFLSILLAALLCFGLFSGIVTFGAAPAESFTYVYATGKGDMQVTVSVSDYTALSGYYLIGPDWTVDAIDENNLFAENPGAEGEYMLETTLRENDKIKVVKVENGTITAWYPDGMNNEYTVDAAHAGSATIYFRTSYQNDWSAFGGYFYIESNPIPVFASQSLTLGGEIGVNFYVTAPSSVTPGKMDFSIENGACTKEATAVATEDGLQYTCYINSVQMADTITATLHYTVNGTEKTLQKTYTAEEYFTALDADVAAHPEKYASEKQQALLALAHATADYGFYVQHFLEKENDWAFPSNPEEDGGQHVETVMHYTEQFESYPVIGDELKLDKSGSANFPTEDIRYSLVLNSKTAIKVYLKPAAGYTDRPTVSVTDAKGAAVTPVVYASGDSWIVEITGIMAQDLDEMFTIKVNGGGTADGGTGATVKVSALSYVRSMMNEVNRYTDADWPHAASRSAWKNAAAAIYAYNRAANAAAALQ